MSLSFVKSAVLSSTDGISHNEETSIDNNETQSLRAGGGGGGSGAHKPLFEQLRANRDEEQERDDEFQRSIRGTRALDEEDCAHLEAVERMREEKEYAAWTTMEQEVELFRAAREDRGLAQTIVAGYVGDDDDDDDDRGSVFQRSAITKKERIQIVPKFTIKKRKIASSSSQELDKFGYTVAKRTIIEKDAANTADNSHACGAKGEGKKKNGTNDNEAPSKSEGKTTGTHQFSAARGGILGLGCYGSDSD